MKAMGNVLSKNGKNNLELYLSDVYKKECVYKINDEEVDFIQTGIETLVQKIVDILHEENFCLDNGPQQEGKSVVEVYFPIKMEHDIDKLLYEKIPHTRSSVIKVGSFYEGTKNNYPDEFDFIFLLYCIEKAPNDIPHYNFLNIFYELMEKHAKVLEFTSARTTVGTRKLKFLEVSKQCGPATKFKFLYENNSETQEISVDLVPAIKIVSGNLKKAVKEWCSLEPFRKKICNTGSVLLTNNRRHFSFTETELHFMRNILSPNHVKVYRILKFVINGHGGYNYDEEEDLFADAISRCRITSYFLKVTMIFHHYECTNSDQFYIGPCILQVLDKMSNFEEKPSLLGTGRIPVVMDLCFSLTPLIHDLSNYFKLIQSSELSYNYETFKITQPLTQEFIDSNLSGSQQTVWPGKCFE